MINLLAQDKFMFIISASLEPAGTPHGPGRRQQPHTTLTNPAPMLDTPLFTHRTAAHGAHAVVASQSAHALRGAPDE